MSGDERPKGDYALYSMTRGPALFLIAVLSIFMVVWMSGPADAQAPEKWKATRKLIKKRARSQLGAPYSYGGSSPSGFDCSGFTRWVFLKHGRSLPHSAAQQFQLGRSGAFKRIRKRGNLEVGDLVFHKTTSAQVGHAGIYVGHGRFISATSSGGVRVQSLWDPYYWGSRWVGATRSPETVRYKK
jgi:cell wall-associated NlpC family hydrolase